MTSFNNTAPAGSTYPAPSFSITSIIEALFMTKLREELDAETTGDKSDAAFHYGL